MDLYQNTESLSEKQSIPVHKKWSKLSEKPSSKNDLIVSIITIPPDGGWGWVVVAVSFMCNFMTDGSIYTFGIFLEKISQTFNVNPTTVALGSSIMIGVCCISGPFACALINRCGFQVIGFVGGLVLAATFIISSELSHIYLFLIIFGVIGGLGVGMVYVTSIVVIGFYFEKWRALATSIGATGSAVGIVTFPIVMNFLKDYPWQSKFKIVASGFALIGFLALLYRPLKPMRVVTKDKNIVHFLPESDSIGSFHLESKSGFLKRLFHRFHNVKYPTAAEIHYTSSGLILNVVESLSSGVTNISNESYTSCVNYSSSKLTTPTEKFSSVITEVNSAKSTKNVKFCGKCFCRCLSCKCHLLKNRPMYRDDIFYPGSLFALPNYSVISQAHQYHPSTSQYEALEYLMSVSRVRTQKDFEDEKKHFKCCPESVVRTLVTMLSCTLIKSPSFMLLSVSGFFTVLGMYSPYIYLIKRATEFGIDENVSYQLFTTLGIFSAVGRITTGAISTIPRVKPLVVSYISLLMCGIATITSCYLKTVTGQFIYYGIFALTIACLSTLRAPIAVELLGIEHLTNAFGIILLFQGFAAFLGMPLAGFIVKLSHSYNEPFIFAGASIILSAFMLIPIKSISDWENKRKNTNNSKN